jgi:hypothetical protein
LTIESWAGPRSTIAAERNWHRIDKAPEGIGPLFLCAGPDLSDPTYVGDQADDGRWLAAGDNSTEVHPTHYCEIPLFDATNDEATS